MILLFPHQCLWVVVAAEEEGVAGGVVAVEEGVEGDGSWIGNMHSIISFCH